MEIIDLSKEIKTGMTVPSEEDDGYEDPEFTLSRTVVVNPWVTLGVKDFAVAEITMGTHTGTHCDVESHIIKDGKSVSDYPIETWIGWASIIDLTDYGEVTASIIEQFAQKFRDPQAIPIIRKHSTDYITAEARSKITEYRPKAIVLGRGANQAKIDDTIGYLSNNVPMIMESDFDALDEIEDGDLIIAVPLKLIGTEAAPIRLIAIRGLIDIEG